MHRLPSNKSVLRFRLAALLFCLKHLLLAATSGVLLWSLVTYSSRLAELGALMALAAGVVTLSFWVTAGRAGCPLCMTPLLSLKKCVPHRRARPLFFSHRLRVAVGILFKKRFQCPYCNECTAVEARERPRP